MSDQQDRELYDLCKSVYEKTNWSGTTEFYSVGFDNSFVVEVEGGWQSEDSSCVFDERHDVPLYTSDYLLDKLLKVIQSIKFITLSNGNSLIFYDATKPDLSDYEAKSPLQCLLKLTLTLLKSGELK